MFEVFDFVHHVIQKFSLDSLNWNTNMSHCLGSDNCKVYKDHVFHLVLYFLEREEQTQLDTIAISIKTELVGLCFLVLFPLT